MKKRGRGKKKKKKKKKKKNKKFRYNGITKFVKDDLRFMKLVLRSF